MSDSKEDRYLLARRSLHVWPLDNASPDSLAAFAGRYLKLTESEFNGFEITSIRLCRQNPQAKIQREYCEEFSTVAERDCFKSYAPRLQEFNRYAGMRLSLPDFLVSTFKMLEHEGYRIAQHRPGTKRNIRFNDISCSLVMDVKLPSASWVRVTPEDIHRAGRRRRESVPAVLELLAIAAEDLPVVRLGTAEHQANQSEPQLESGDDMMGDDEAAEKN